MLIDMGFPVKFTKFIIALIFKRTYQVKIGDSLSNISDAPSGVVQGSVLGVYFFVLFVNTLPSVLKPFTSYLFVDDVKFFAFVDSFNVCYSLQSACDRLFNWSLTNCLPISNTKSGVMHLGYNNPHVTYTIGSLSLPVVSEFSDLGILFSSDLNFSKHYANIISKANKVSYLIRKAYVKCNNDTLVFAFNVYVRPILEFSSPVWSP